MKKKASWALLKNPVHFCSLGAGSGLLPGMPGTYGSLLALFLFLPLTQLPFPVILTINAVLFLIGCLFCDFTARVIGRDDPSQVVFDEIVGMFFVLAFTPVSVTFYLIAFILFRIFDVLKPWPIKGCDKNIKGGFGIMLDDLLAALYTIIIMQIILIIL